MINVSLILRIFCASIIITRMVSYKEKYEKLCVILFFIINCSGTVLTDYFLQYPHTILGVVDAQMFVKTVQVLLLFFVVGLFAKGGIIKQIFAIAIIDAVTAVLEFLSAGINYLVFRDTFSIYLSDSWSTTFIFLIIYVAFIIIGWKPLERFAASKIENYILVQIISLAYVIMGCSSIYRSFYQLSKDDIHARMSFGIFTAIILVFIVVWLREKNISIRNENLDICLQEQMKKEHMALLQEQYRTVRQMRHDLRKHIDFLDEYRTESSDSEVSAQLDGYKQNLVTISESLGTGNYCPNQDVNMMFYQLEKCCRSHGIDFSIQLRNLQFADMDAKMVYDTFWDTIDWWKKELVAGTCNRYKMLEISGQETYEISAIKIEGRYQDEVAEREKCDGMRKVLRF